MFVTAQPPNLTLYSIAVFMLLIVSLISVLYWMISSSWRDFLTDTDIYLSPKCSHTLAWQVFRKGWISTKTFYLFVVLQFVIVTISILFYERQPFLVSDGDTPQLNSLSAYTGDPDNLMTLMLARIHSCDWNDRFKLSTLSDNWILSDIKENAEKTTNFVDRRVAEYVEFYQLIEDEYAKRAPNATKELSESLKPVFLVVAGFFVLIIRAQFQQSNDHGYVRLVNLISTSLVAFVFFQLGSYYVIAYTWQVELNRALSAGRIVCTEHHKEFFISQLQAVTVAALIEILLFSLLPGKILKKV